MKVLFLNHSKQQCGVYQYGKRMYDNLKKTHMYQYVELETLEEYYRAIQLYSPMAIVYNYHPVTMTWLNSETIQKAVPNVGIPHENTGELFDIVCSTDPDEIETNGHFSLPRPIYENVDMLLEQYIPSPSIKAFIDYSEEGVPVFGSFGFGFLNKGFYKIIQLINATYDKAIIKLIIPGAYFDGNRDHTNYTMKKICESIPRKPSIQLLITHEFVTNEEVLLFLRSNTMNLFLYDTLEGKGISSVMDYALSVHTPFAISDSTMFKHFYSDDVCVYKTPIRDCMKHSPLHIQAFIEKNSVNRLIKKFDTIFDFQTKRGVFYNSKKSLCSIWESGKMCYDALKKSDQYTLDYSEETFLDNSYDFAIFNQHGVVNNWMTHDMLKIFKKPTFCVVTEVTFGDNPVASSPDYFDHYIVLDSTVQESEKIHAFGRPLEAFDLTEQNNQDVPKVFSFGFSTYGKDWHKIVDAVQADYDVADIHFNIPKATYVPEEQYHHELRTIISNCQNILYKPSISLRITGDNLTKTELIQLCSEKTINCFFYNREHLFQSGLAAVTDQAISSGRPLLVTSDRTFRHIQPYLDIYPTIGIKEAIQRNREGVLKMKEEWSPMRFVSKFERLIDSV